MSRMVTLAFLLIFLIQLFDNEAEASRAVPLKQIRRCRCKGSRIKKCPSPLIPAKHEAKEELNRCLCKLFGQCLTPGSGGLTL